MWPDGGLRGNGEMELGETLGEEGEMQGLGVGRRPGTGLRSGCDTDEGLPSGGEMEAGCALCGDAEIRGLGTWMRPGTRLHGDDNTGTSKSFFFDLNICLDNLKIFIFKKKAR
ncbi:hypothetical protein E2562_002427 [Oryza meyeriana var. granulata]|uniref:Uncharacterized protein n=1 Tax=Oryza meyeriana var. granulata TaxID=110450 RepID=A0A6G1F2J0_9ORYZ|nr:hypothetical protein E2562_002427 [Oryza meyeriana var. granulata]